MRPTLLEIDVPLNWKQQATWILKANLVALTINFLILFLLSLFLQVDMIALVRGGFFPTILLLDSGFLFLAGGLIAMAPTIFPSKIREYIFHSHEEWSQERHRKGEKRANLYILAGIVLFLESLASASLVL